MCSPFVSVGYALVGVLTTWCAGSAVDSRVISPPSIAGGEERAKSGRRLHAQHVDIIEEDAKDL